MHWQFRPMPNDVVEQGITQSDQFENEDQTLSSTLVREFLQNSLDAATTDGTPVEVKFRRQDKEKGLTPDFMNKMFEGHLEHAKAPACQLNIDEIDFTNPTGIVIEEFGTTGLTGLLVCRNESRDDANWSNFWFVHGKPTKSGSQRGRWGLGKLVYSKSSALRVFFGLTVRHDDPLTDCKKDMYLMGQTVLTPHWAGESDDREYFPAHSFFSELERSGPNKGMPIPITDTAFIDECKENFGMEREPTQAGLSVFIPFEEERLDWKSMIEEAIVSFFFPIITGQLVLSFDDVVIDSSTINDMANKYARDRIADTEELFTFIREVWTVVQGSSSVPLINVREEWWKDKTLDADDFSDHELKKARDLYKAGQPVAIKLPVELKHRTKDVRKSYLHIFVQKPGALDQGHDLYVRNGLLIPKESKFRGRPALGVLIVEDEAMSEFVGDAENAAHTQLSGYEKLRQNWVNPIPVITALKNSLRDFYDILAQSVDDEDELALLNFFWSPSSTPAMKKKKKKTSVVTPLPIITKESRYEIRLLQGGGVAIQSSSQNPPVVGSLAKITLAYQVSRGNAFRKWRPYDFDLGSASGDIVHSISGATVISCGGNTIELKINSSTDFKVKLQGFGAERDLKVSCV